MTILGIESSCDETAAALVKNGTILLSNVVASSQKIHQKYGGIVPEIAARKQVEYIVPVVKEALANVPKEKIDSIAVTIGPGLIGSLLVGVEFAKTLSYLWQKPIIPVNHLVGHIYANFLQENLQTQKSKLKSQNQISKLKTNKSLPSSPLTLSLPSPIEFPALVLIVSGGHTELVLMKNHGVFENIGGTRDDAAGEAFDKAARLLNLGYPGGPAIQKAAEKGNPKAFNLPRPLFNSPDFDFSFSGLKTALLHEVAPVKNVPDIVGDIYPRLAGAGATSQEIRDLAASFQQAVIDCLIRKSLKAIQTYHVKSFLLAGGVAANLALRDALEEAITGTSEEKVRASACLRRLARSPSRHRRLEGRSDLLSPKAIKFFVPPLAFCTDNAAAIASTAFFNNKPMDWTKIKADPGLGI